MELFIIGLIVALNIIVIMSKFKKGRIEDGVFDTTLLIIITILFQSSYAGLVVSMVASLLISIYLYASPPRFFSGKNGIFEKVKERYEKNKPRRFQ